MHIFARQSIRTSGKSTHVLKVANFMINLKDTKLLSFCACFKVVNRAWTDWKLKRHYTYHGKNQWDRQVVHYGINFAYLFRLLVGISSFCLLLSFYVHILCSLQSFKFFSRVVTYRIVPWVTRNWIDMISATACLNIELDYGYGLTDKLPAKAPAKELR